MEKEEKPQKASIGKPLIFPLNGPPLLSQSLSQSVIAAIDSALSSSCLPPSLGRRSYSAVLVNPDLCKEQKNSALRKREERKRERERERERGLPTVDRRITAAIVASAGLPAN